MSIFNAAARRSVGLEVRKEDQVGIPFELYQIKPEQIVFYVSPKGVDKNSLSKIGEAFLYLSEVYNGYINWSIISTDNEFLIDSFAGRCKKVINVPPYKVVVGSWDTIADFASQIFDKDIKTITDSFPAKEYKHISITKTKLTTTKYIDPKKCPANNF